MLSQIASIRTAFPSAFSALGVGTLALMGILPFVLIFRLEFGAPDVSEYVPKGSIVANAIPFLIAAAAFFYTYAMGMIFISTGSRLRGETPFNDAERLFSVFENKNELFVKYFFEQKSTIELFDGIAVGLGFTVTINSLPVIFLMHSYIIGAATLIMGLGLGWSMSRESKSRIRHLEILLSLYGKGEDG